MATYKVIQDIEAEDKLLGPLTLRQFIYAGIALLCGYIQFLMIVRGAAFVIIFFLPPMLVFGFLAWPFGRDQPTETWVLAKLRFMIKPRRRIWDQAGVKDLVTVTAPVKDDHTYTDGLSQGEVKSRLQALAKTIDSRGWAVKNVAVNLPDSSATVQASDRLVNPSNFPQEVSGNDVGLADDMLDERNNPTAQNLDRMISAKATNYKQSLLDKLRQPAQPAQPVLADGQPADYWFLNQPSGPIPAGKAVFDSGQTILPEDNSGQPPVAAPAMPEPAMSNMHTVQPLGAKPQPTPSSKTPDPAILELAKNNDLNVDTIARQVNKNPDDGEVVVPLR